jgi:glycosyltransferase involved in cell wall biosynthesis
MRVVVLSPAAELGGAERSLLTFLKVAQGSLVDARVLLPREGPLGQALTKLGVPWEVAPMPLALLRFSRQKGSVSPRWSLKGFFQGAKYALSMQRKLKDLAPEIIYTNGIKSHILGALLRPWVKGRIIWHVRDFWEGRYVGFLGDWGPHAIIANSWATARSLKERMRQPEKVSVVYNAVDGEEFSPTGTLPSSGPWAGFSPRVGLVAAYARWKGHSLFFKAAQRIMQEYPTAGFLVIGGSIYDSGGEVSYEEELTRLTWQAGLKDRVFFTGFQEDVAPWYRALDVVVNSSLRPEPFGRTRLEAMACGRAVVGPAAGGVPEFVRHGENGLLYAMGHAKELTTAILTLLRKPSLRSRLGEVGRETAVRYFAPEDHATTMARAFQEAMI